jgi:ribosomal-protein-alanine N-acetyltransferase
MIQTPRLDLHPCDLTLWAAILDGNAALNRTLGVNVPRGWTENRGVFPRFFEQIKTDPSLETWWAYLIVHRSDNLLIGSGGFKGSPTPEGTVEIGYEIRPSHRGHGLATEAARGLIAFAFQHPEVRAVQAHTLATETASGSVLRKLGFQRLSEHDDPEDGLIWRWQLSRHE